MCPWSRSSLEQQRRFTAELLLVGQRDKIRISQIKRSQLFHFLTVGFLSRCAQIVGANPAEIVRKSSMCKCSPAAGRPLHHHNGTLQMSRYVRSVWSATASALLACLLHLLDILGTLWRSGTHLNRSPDKPPRAQTRSFLIVSMVKLLWELNSCTFRCSRCVRRSLEKTFTNEAYFSWRPLPDWALNWPLTQDCIGIIDEHTNLYIQ